MSHSTDDFDLSGTGLGADLSGIDLGRVWTGVAAEVWRRHPGRVERIAARLLRSPALARALLNAPSLLVPWLISTVVIFTAGGLVNVVDGKPLVWLLAPAIAGIGIAYCYGPGIDPAWELNASMAVSDRMVLMVRALAVFAVNAIIGIIVSAISNLVTLHVFGTHSSTGHVVAVAAGHTAAITFAWLLPMTAICAVTLAAAVASRSANVGAGVGVAAWTSTVLATWAASGTFTAAVSNDLTYLPYLIVAACATVVIGYSTRTQRGAL
jgi:hypothetical protein